MIEFDITTIVANALIGIGLGLAVVTFVVWRIIRKFETDLRAVVREAVAEVEANMIGLIVEQEGDVIYAYTEQDRQFVCQGATVTEIREGFKNRYPEKTAYLAGGDADLVERFKTELVKLKEKEASENSLSV
jgi:predicted small secreted protein